MSAHTTGRRRLRSVVVGASLTLAGGGVLAAPAMASTTATITTACNPIVGPGAVNYDVEPNSTAVTNLTTTFDTGLTTHSTIGPGNSDRGLIFLAYGQDTDPQVSAANQVTFTLTDASGTVLATRTANRADCGARPTPQPTPVTPTAPVFNDQPGTAHDTYTIPATPGVDYVVNGKAVAPGTYPATGDVTIEAVAKNGYAVKGTSSWTHMFTNVPPVTPPTQVTPPAPVFNDQPGSDKDTVTVPASDCVSYLLNGKAVAPGTYLATGAVTVKAVAKCGECVLEGQTTWTHQFSNEGGTPPVEQPGPQVPVVEKPAPVPPESGPIHNPPAAQPQAGSVPVVSAGLNQGFGAKTGWDEHVTSPRSDAWRVGLGLLLIAFGLGVGAFGCRRRTGGAAA